MTGFHHTFRILHGNQPIAVSTDKECVRLSKTSGNGNEARMGYLLHFPQGAPPYRSVVGRIASGGPGGEMEGDVFAEILNGGDQSSHGTEGSIVKHGFCFPLAVFPAVSLRKTFLRHLCILVISIRHSQGEQNIPGNVLLERNP